MADRPLRRRPFALLATVVLVAVIGVVYGQAVFAHISVYELPAADVVLTGFAPTPDGDALSGTIRFTNVASRQVTVYGAGLTLYANDRMVSDPAGTSTESTTVAPGETVTIPAEVDFLDRSREAGLAAYRNGSLRIGGDLFVGFGDRNIRVDIEPRPIDGGTADG